MIRRLAFAFAVTLVSAKASVLAADVPPKPARIVSLNMCTDELVLRLAERQNIASVTWLSRDAENSNVAEAAAHVPVNHGLAEEVIPLNPDLVVAGAFTSRTAVALLKRAGVRVSELGVPRSLGEAKQQIRDVADLLGERDKGERMFLALARDRSLTIPC